MLVSPSAGLRQNRNRLRRALVRRFEKKGGTNALVCPRQIHKIDFFTYCSNPSCSTGSCSLALASDFNTIVSANSAEVFRAVAISLTSKYLARSSIVFSRKESGLLLLREHKLLRTTATSRRDPVRILSEFSLKRCFQSWWQFSLPRSKNPNTLLVSIVLTTDRSPTLIAFDWGTMTRKPLDTIRIM